MYDFAQINNSFCVSGQYHDCCTVIVMSQVSGGGSNSRPTGTGGCSGRSGIYIYILFTHNMFVW